MTRLTLVITTVSNEADAQALSDSILQSRLAACVTTLPRAQSRYWWEGEITSSAEWLLMIKTTTDRMDALRDHVAHHHPYDTPEFIEIPIQSALAAYAAWVQNETRPQ